MSVVTEPALTASDGPKRSTVLALLPRKQNLIPFLLGLLVAPFFIVLHEGAHFLTAKALRIRAELHYGATTVHYLHLPPPPADLLVTAAGPFVQALVGGAGFFWLYRLRRVWRMDPATCVDWLATWAALNAGRWLAGWVPAPYQPRDLRMRCCCSRQAACQSGSALVCLASRRSPYSLRLCDCIHAVPAWSPSPTLSSAGLPD